MPHLIGYILQGFFGNTQLPLLSLLMSSKHNTLNYVSHTGRSICMHAGKPCEARQSYLSEDYILLCHLHPHRDNLCLIPIEHSSHGEQHLHSFHGT